MGPTFFKCFLFFTDFSIHTVGLQHVASEQEGLIATIDMIDYFDVTALRVYTTVHCNTNSLRLLRLYRLSKAALLIKMPL